MPGLTKRLIAPGISLTMCDNCAMRSRRVLEEGEHLFGCPLWKPEHRRLADLAVKKYGYVAVSDKTNS